MKRMILSSTNDKRFMRLTILTMVLLLLFSRAITLTHNMYLHVDEGVVYESADSLLHFIVGTENEYAEVKEYPEGAIVLQLPIHIAGALFRHSTGIELPAQLCGRLASVFYFVLGAVFGMIIEYKCLGKNRTSVLTYAVILVFSVMHIEQSRYSTAESVSFFLTMAILFFTVIGEEKEKNKRTLCWLSAGFLGGLLCAVKYPLLF